MVSRWAHNSKVGGSKPLSAIFFHLIPTSLFIPFLSTLLSTPFLPPFAPAPLVSSQSLDPIVISTILKEALFSVRFGCKSHLTPMNSVPAWLVQVRSSTGCALKSSPTDSMHILQNSTRKNMVPCSR